MTLKDDSNPIEAALKRAIKLANERGETKNAGHLEDVLGCLRKRQIGDSFAMSVAEGALGLRYAS